MKTTSKQEPVISDNEIAEKARQIWSDEGRHHGRDQEYWFRARNQLLAGKEAANGNSNGKPAKGKSSATQSRNPAFRSLE